jgi:ABC-2 type transport system permease protein
MFPLDMLTNNLAEPWSTLVKFNPLQYLAYFPAAVFLGKIQGTALWTGLAIEAGWVLFFIVLCRVIYWRGLARYSGFGG